MYNFTYAYTDTYTYTYTHTLSSVIPLQCSSSDRESARARDRKRDRKRERDRELERMGVGLFTNTFAPRADQLLKEKEEAELALQTYKLMHAYEQAATPLRFKVCTYNCRCGRV